MLAGSDCMSRTQLTASARCRRCALYELRAASISLVFIKAVLTDSAAESAIYYGVTTGAISKNRNARRLACFCKGSSSSAKVFPIPPGQVSLADPNQMHFAKCRVAAKETGGCAGLARKSCAPYSPLQPGCNFRADGLSDRLRQCCITHSDDDSVIGLDIRGEVDCSLRESR